MLSKYGQVGRQYVCAFDPYTESASTESRNTRDFKTWMTWNSPRRCVIRNCGAPACPRRVEMMITPLAACAP